MRAVQTLAQSRERRPHLAAFLTVPRGLEQSVNLLDCFDVALIVNVLSTSEAGELERTR